MEVRKEEREDEARDRGEERKKGESTRGAIQMTRQMLDR